jgi:hypothetical protein
LILYKYNKGENNMDKIFDTTKAIDEYDRNLRSYLSWITPTELRNIIVKTHEVQVDMAKYVSTSLNKNFSNFVSTTSK